MPVRAILNHFSHNGNAKHRPEMPVLRRDNDNRADSTHRRSPFRSGPGDQGSRFPPGAPTWADLRLDYHPCETGALN